MRSRLAACMVVAVSIFLAGYGIAQAESVSVNGVALVIDPYTKMLGTGKSIGYLVDGQAFAYEKGSAFTFTPIQLPDGAIITDIKCVVRDNSEVGYIQANLLRGPINTVDPAYQPKIIATAVTTPGGQSTAFQEITAIADQNYSVVDNSNYGYFLRVDFLSNPGINDKNLSFRGCVINY